MIAIAEFGALLNNFANDQYQQTWVSANQYFTIAIVLFTLGVAFILEVAYQKLIQKSRLPNA